MSYDGYGIPQIKDGQDHLGGNINEGDPYTYCPTVWNYLIDRFCIKSVMDLGSGRGHCANYFFFHPEFYYEIIEFLNVFKF